LDFITKYFFESLLLKITLSLSSGLHQNVLTAENINLKSFRKLKSDNTSELLLCEIV